MAFSWPIEPREALADFDHAAVDREVRPQRFHRLDPGRRVALEPVADAGDLVVAPVEEAPPVARVVELARSSFSNVSISQARISGIGYSKCLRMIAPKPVFTTTSSGVSSSVSNGRIHGSMFGTVTIQSRS